MSRSEFDALDLVNLKEFVGYQIEEGTYIDYKSDISMPLTKDKKKELLKDVAGFANAAGGLIIYGCDEPDTAVCTTDQLCGIADGSEISIRIERVLSDCLDPRVPSIGVKHIPIAAKTSVIVVFIPPSNIRPHMTKPENRFYMRHSESTLPMNTQEVKTAVISAYNRDDLMASMKHDVESKFQTSDVSRSGCCIVMQAIPLTELSEAWPVFDPEIKNVLQGLGKRTDFHPDLTLCTGQALRIDVEEVYSVGDSGYGNSWELHVRADGHVYLFAPIFNKDPTENPFFTSFLNQFFCVFGSIVDELLAVTNSSHGYQIVTEIKDTKLLKLYRDTRHYGGGFRGPLDREQLTLPNQVALAGDSVETVCEGIGAYIYQAFGVLPSEGELKKRGDPPSC